MYKALCWSEVVLERLPGSDGLWDRTPGAEWVGSGQYSLFPASV